MGGYRRAKNTFLPTIGFIRCWSDERACYSSRECAVRLVRRLMRGSMCWRRTARHVYKCHTRCLSG